MKSIFYSSITTASKYIGAGIGIVLGISRNSLQEPKLFQLTLLGFALCEAMGLLSIMTAFLILYS